MHFIINFHFDRKQKFDVEYTARVMSRFYHVSFAAVHCILPPQRLRPRRHDTRQINKTYRGDSEA